MQSSLFITEKREYENWLLVDGNNLMNRCYYATANSLSKDDKNPLNAVSGFLKSCFSYQKKYNANIIVFFDKGKGFRKRAFPQYKEGRNETPAQLEVQFPLIRELLNSANIPYYWSEQLEADDLICSACNCLNGHKYILSNDKDLIQVVREDVSVIVRKGKNDVLMTPELFISEWEGLSPIQITDIKALAGDSSDNIPGVAGIGDKGALGIVKHFKSIENIQLPFPSNLKRYEKKFSEQGAFEDALFYKKLTTLVSHTKLEIKKYKVNTNRLLAHCQSLNLHSVVKLLHKQ